MLRDLEPLSTTIGAYAFVVLLGLLWGSFANVCIYRWPPSEEFPNGRSVVKPGSHCFACGTEIRWYDNVPLLAWLWLRGKCRTCKVAFSARYLIVEAVTGALFGFAWWATISAGVLWEPFDVRLLRFAIYATFCFVMVVVTFIDIDHKLILNKVTIPSMVVFYALSLLLPERHWSDGLVGLAVGYGLPWAVGEIYWLLAERDGLGLGDSMLLAVIGALLGIEGVIASLLGGAMVGAVIGVIVLLGARPVADASSTAPPPSRWGTVLAVVAVASVVVAAAAALAGWIIVGMGGAILASASLVIARRIEPGDDTDPGDAKELAGVPEAARAMGGKEIGVRVLALVAGMLILFAVTLAAVDVRAWALGIGVVGFGLLLGARKLVVHAEEPSATDAPDPDRGTPSLMSTELPFGPFLAIAALFYLFAQPWIQLHFHLPGG